jgi:Leucyl aminopeptidase
MTIKINYTNKTINKEASNLVLFCDEKYSVSGIKKYISNDEFSYINDLIRKIDVKKDLFIFEVNSKKKIVLISIKKNLKTSDIENLGAGFYKKINSGNSKEYSIVSDSVPGKNENFLGYFLHGLKLKSYEFKKYKTKKESKNILINVVSTKNKPSVKNQFKI